MKTMDLCQLWLRCRCIILIRTILVLNRTLFFRIVWTPLPTRRSSPSWKNSHRVILLWWCGDGAIRAAVSEVFPDALMAMCWFHCKHASKRHMGKYSACSHFTLFALFFVYLRKVEKPIPTHLQGDIGRPRTVPKLRNWSRNVQRHLGSAGEEVRRRIWLSFWGGEESHAWFPHPLFQEDVRDFKDAKWLLAGFHPTSTSDKQPSGKVRVSYSHYFCNYILIRTILVIISLFALFC